MKIFIVADLEGASSVVAGPDEPRDGEAIAGDVNAAIEGAFDGGAKEVIVRDFHHSGRNILPEALDSRAILVRGSALPQGGAEFDSSYDMIFLLGFHPPSGDPLGITPHTFDEGYRVFINQKEMGEAEVLAALAGAEGVGVGLISGDERFVKRFKEFLPSVRSVITKRALSGTSAECRHPAAVRQELRQMAKEAVAAAGTIPKLVLQSPYHLEIKLPSIYHAVAAEWIPQVVRVASDRVRFESTDFRQVFKLIYLFIGLGSIVADWK